MGRWAQRRRAGGGPPASSTIIQITTAAFASLIEVNVGYSADVNASDFDPSNFTMLPDNVTAITVSQLSSDILIIDFGEDVTTSSEIRYIGTVTNVLSPQTVEITL